MGVLQKALAAAAIALMLATSVVLSTTVAYLTLWMMGVRCV